MTAATSIAIDRKVYCAIRDSFAATRSDLLQARPRSAASGLVEITSAQLNASLKRLESAGHICSDDVNNEAQGSRRRGQFKELIFQVVGPSIDDDPEDHEFYINEHFPIHETKEPKMAPTKTRKAPAKKAPAKAKETPAPKEEKVDLLDLAAAVKAGIEDDGLKLGEIAKQLGTTPGRAAFSLLVAEAEASPKLQIKVKTDDEAPDVIVEAREAGLSWGQIAARLKVGGKRISEPKIKRLFGEAGGEFTSVHELRKDAETEEAPAPKKTPPKKAPAKKAPAPRRSRKSAPDPS